MTITSGLAQVGKTHLAINLALELVRRGRLAGVFHDSGQISAVDELLDLPRPALLQRRTGENGDDGIMRRGYQGVDVLSGEMPIREWLDLDAEQPSPCGENIDIRDGYDDFLIDTSGMDARSLLACCKTSAVVMLILTPESRSQVESFALLRVLQLNGFSGELCMLVNRITDPVEAEEIYSNFSRVVKVRLGLDVAFLGYVPEDRQVQLAQHNRHAFSSLFPDSGAAAAMVVAANALDDIPAHFVAGPQTLAVILEALVDMLQLPVCLPGGVVLEDVPGSGMKPDKLPPAAGREQAGELSLLQYAGDVPGLWNFLDMLPLALHSLAVDLEDLVAVAGRSGSFKPGAGDAELPGKQVLQLLAELLEAFAVAGQTRTIELEVTDLYVSGQQYGWLQAGRYLRYAFRLSRESLPEPVTALLDRVPVMTRSTGAEGEEIRELLDPAQNSCLSVISSSQAGTRIQLLLPLVRDQPRPQESGVIATPGKGLH